MAEVGVFFELSILLTIAVISHFFAKRFHQSTIVGEILIGVVMGPTVAGFFLNGWRPPVAGSPALFDTTPGGFVGTFATLGAIFLLFILGLESDVRALFQRRNVAIAAGGVVLPWVAGFALTFLMVPDADIPATSTRLATAVFVGATLVATSTAIAAAILLEMGKAKTEVASVIIGAAVVDDILALMVLSIAQGVAGGGVEVAPLALVVIAAILFVVVGTWLGLRLFSRLVVGVHVRGLRLGLTRGGFMIAMAIAFLYAMVAELIGLSAIIGAFIAGAMLSRTPLHEQLKEGAGYLSTVFTPIFFISLGLFVNMWSVGGNFTLIAFAALLVVFAAFTKLAGCGIPARLSGMTRKQSLVVATGMIPRGEMGLVIALAAFPGVIGESLFSIIVVVIIAVSLVPAPFLRQLIKEMEEETPPAPA